MSYTDLQKLFDPLYPEGQYLCYWKSLELNHLADEAIDANVTAAESRPSPRTINVVWHLGGTMCRLDSAETAYGDRDATYLLSVDSMWTDAADTEANIAWTREVWADMHRYSDGWLYLNFPGFREEGQDLLRAAFGEENYEQLVALKNTYDPSNLFRTNQNIAPTV